MHEKMYSLSEFDLKENKYRLDNAFEVTTGFKLPRKKSLINLGLQFN